MRLPLGWHHMADYRLESYIGIDAIQTNFKLSVNKEWLKQINQYNNKHNKQISKQTG